MLQSTQVNSQQAPKSSGNILTSIDNLHLLEEKENQKELENKKRGKNVETQGGRLKQHKKRKRRRLRKYKRWQRSQRKTSSFRESVKEVKR